MTAAEINNEVMKLRAREERLRADVARENEILVATLAAEPARFKEDDARESRRRKARSEEQLAECKERIAALEAQLPTPEEVAAATSKADALSHDAAQANQRYEAMSRKHAAAIDQNEKIARELVAAEADARQVTGELHDLVRRFGLQTAIPEVSRPSALDAEVVYLAGIFTAEAVYGEPSDTVLIGLENARAKQIAARESLQPMRVTS